MKKLLFFLALALGAQTGFKPNPITGQLDLVGLPGGANQSSTTAGASTGVAVDITALNVSSQAAIIGLCWTGATTQTALASTWVASGGPPYTTVTFAYSSTANVTCKVNATGSAGATGATGPTGATGATGATGPSGLLSGTLAAIPATCTVGASLYQATDQPITTQIYQCTATNTWTRAAYTQATTHPATCTVGQLFFDTDATAGSNLELCTASNTWTAISGTGAVASVTAGASGAITSTPTTGAVVVDIDTAYVPGKTTSNTWTGANIFGGGTLFNGGIDAQTGTSYTIVAADINKIVTFNNGSSVAVTLPQATTTGFTVGAFFHVYNRGAGAVTITPTTSTINGSATVVLNQNQGAYVVSDGTNYSAWVSSAPSGSGTVTSVAQSFTGGLISVGGSPITTSGTLALTVAGTSGGVPYFSSSSAWASSGAMGAGQFMLGGGAGSTPTSANLSGDVTTSGSAATTVVKINGTTMSGLATGILKNTTSTGVPSIATQSDISSPGYVAGGGTAQAQTATLSPAIAAQAAGLRVCWLPAAANTGAAPTIAINGLTAKNITKFGTTALVANDITTAAVACAVYDGTQYQLQNPQTNSASGTVTVSGGGSLTSTALVTGAGTTVLQTPAATATMDSSGNISTPGSIASGVGGSVGGTVELGQGTAPSLGTTSAKIYAPTSVTSYGIVLPGAAATGFTLRTNSSNVMTETQVGSSGSGNVVLVTGATMVTPTLGVASATTINKVALTAPATGSTLTILDGKTATFNNSITFAGTDSTTMTFPATSATIFGSTTKNDVLQTAMFCSDAGANDTYTCSMSPAITAYVTGTRYRFKANTANTGAASINFNSIGALTIKKPFGGSITADLATNDIRVGQWVEGVYDGTNFQMTSQLGNTPTAGTCISGGSISQVITDDGAGGCTSNSDLLWASAVLQLGVPGGGTYSAQFFNGTSGSVTIRPTTGALGTTTLTLPATTGNIPSIAGALAVASGKTFTASNTLTLAGTDSTVMTFPSTSATIARTDAANTFTGVQTMTSPAITTPAITGLATGSGVASAATASTLASRDANANLTANNHIEGYTTTATAAGTTTLTVGSTRLQFFTGSTTQTVTLPVTSTMVLGQQFVISNNSTGLVTVNSSGSNAVKILGANTVGVFTVILTSGTSAASWDAYYQGSVITSGKLVSHANSFSTTATDGAAVALGAGGTVVYTSTPITQNSKSAAYTTVLGDCMGSIYHPGADTTARTWTIDSNANVAAPIGCTITFVNDTSGGVITIAITSDTLVLAGAGTTGSRSLAANGVATATKVTSTRWLINGTGIS